MPDTKLLPFYYLTMNLPRICLHIVFGRTDAVVNLPDLSPPSWNEKKAVEAFFLAASTCFSYNTTVCNVLRRKVKHYNRSICRGNIVLNVLRITV